MNKEWMSRALAAIGDAAVSDLITAIGDPSPGVRMWEIRALGELRRPDAQTSLIPALDDASHKVRVWVSDAVEFVAEWRYFVHHREIVGVGHYHGDPLRAPDPEVVRAAVAAYQGPAAHVIDLGVLADGQTALVEVNDGFSFGCYGLPPLAHAAMLASRWHEMVGLAED